MTNSIFDGASTLEEQVPIFIRMGGAQHHQALLMNKKVE
jgi:hypothetical protein